MNRYLKILGLALAALVATSALTSSAWGASFTSSGPTTKIIGGQVTSNTITVTGQSVTCATTTLSGHSTGTLIESFTVTPVYTECKALNGSLTATVTGFGHYGEGSTCDYLLWAVGVIDLVCQQGAGVTIDFGTCVVHIKGQTGIGTVQYTNAGSGKLLAHINTYNVRGSHTDGFLCPFAGGGEFTNGEIAGSIEIEGTDAEGESVSLGYDE